MRLVLLMDWDSVIWLLVWPTHDFWTSRVENNLCHFCFGFRVSERMLRTERSNIKGKRETERSA